MIIHGNPLESHSIQTEDGYILQLLRIPLAQNGTNMDSKSKSHPNGTPRPAVLVVHGFCSCGPGWLINTPDKVLPCMLVEEGFDCWIACLRGSSQGSRGHATLSTRSKKYWDFSVHEIGTYDIPSIIDYILETTGNISLYYVGHSMGSTVLFIAINMRPEYNSKVKLMIALSPAVYGRHITNKIVRSLGLLGSHIGGKFRFIYRHQAFGNTFAEYGKKLCPPFGNQEKIGTWLMMKILGCCESIGTDQLEKTRRKAISELLSSPSSFKTGCHIAQCLVANQFRQYDYGRAGNLSRYAQATPPTYDLKKVTVPVITFGAVDDKLVPRKDVAQVAKELGNLIEHREISCKKFTHADFAIGKDADRLIFDPIIQILKTSHLEQF